MRRFGAALLLVTTTSACSMTYRPADGPRASLAMRHGKPVIVKNGHEHEIGMFGGGLEDALGNDPDARRHAEDFHDGMVSGFVETLGGAVALGAAAGFGVADAAQCMDAQPRCASHPLVTAALITAAAGAALYTLGLVTMMRAQPHLYDAINVYNDHVEGRKGQQDEGKNDAWRAPVTVASEPFWTSPSRLGPMPPPVTTTTAP